MMGIMGGMMDIKEKEENAALVTNDLVDTSKTRWNAWYLVAKVTAW